VKRRTGTLLTPIEDSTVDTQLKYNFQDQYLGELLREHKGKNFVQRILDPAKYPVLDLPGTGSHATHKMAVEVDDETGNWIAFPTIMQDGDKLTDYGLNGPREAMREAMKRGEYIDFGYNKDMALWFGKNYKRAWR
jgi:hypothetical protein